MPNGERTRFTFGTEYYKTEGKLLKEEILSAGGAQLRLTENEYAINPVSPPYSYYAGTGVLTSKSDEFASAYQVPLLKKTVLQQGHIFESEYSNFTETVTPKTIYQYRRAPNSGQFISTHQEEKTLDRFTNTWVLDLVSLRREGTGEISNTGLIFDTTEAIRTRDPITFLPTSHQSIGRVEYSYEYHPDGSLKKILDPSLKAVTLDSWKRGTPQLVTYADQKTSSAIVDNFGALFSQTDELGYASTIGRDNMGRISSISHPTGDSVAWNSLSAGFVQVTGPAFGLPANHWQRTITVGNKITRQYFDALYRPVLTEEFDSANPASTRTFVTAAFDHAGRTTFQSYPVRTISQFSDALPGTRTSFDALGRATQVSQSNGASLLNTTTEYQSGFKKRVVNPRGKATTFEYQAFGEPSEESPVKITFPESVVVEINRDVMGRINHLKRSGPGPGGTFVTAQRNYSRDELGRNCAVYEPERGTTYTHFATDGTVDWSATVPGLPLYCETAYPSIPESAKTYHSYDQRKRLTGVSFPDGTPGTLLTYYDDGAVKTAASDGTLWEFMYNKRRLLTQEKLTVGAKVYSLGYGYDANASASSMTYPDGQQIDYAPNALGQPSKVGSFATGLQYSASGALTNFSYGNTLTHSMTQNARLLPGRVQVRNAAGTSAILDTTLNFDENGNVLGLTDGVAATNQSRGMTYDDLDRLKTVSSNASSMFGNASYSYDGLDNLTSLSVTAGAKARSYSYNITQATQRLTDISNSSGQTVFNLIYDDRGNVTSRSGSNSATVGFVFDRADRIRQFTSSAAGASENYRYDAKGRRALIQKVADASQQRFQVYSGAGQLVWEEDQTGSSKRHVYLGNTLLARVDSDAGGAPIAPASITVTPEANTAGVNTGTLQVSWAASASSGTITYQLERQLCTVAPTEVCAGWQLIPRATASSLQWTQLDSPEGGRMLFRVVACAAKVCGTDWRVSPAYDHSPPKTNITELPTSPQASSFSISWAAAIGANSYDVQRSIDLGSWSTQALNQTVLSTTVTPTGTVNASYRFRVRAKFNGKTRGYGVESAAVLYQPVTSCMPIAPSNMAASANLSSTGNFSLSWGASNCGATRYQVEEKIGGAAFAFINETTGNTLALNRVDGSYQYRVRACKPAVKGGGEDCSAYSSPVAVSVQIVCTPAAPSNLQVNPSVSTNGNFTLSWGVSTCGAVRYFVEEKQGNGAFVVNTPETSALSMALIRLNADYQYRVRACKPDPQVGPIECPSYSASASVSVQIPGGLAAPTGLLCRYSISGGTPQNCDRNISPFVRPRTRNEFIVSWNAVPGATRYEWCDDFDEVTCGTQLSLSQAFTLMADSMFGLHSYRVRACNASACSAYSAPSLEVDVACGAPSGNCSGSREARAQSTVYIHTDQLGSPVAETDASGALLQRFRYEPYGQSIEANIAQGPGYTGHVADQASGLIYMEARYYDPIIGRFLSTDPDPVNGLGTNFNRYAYAGNNPYTFVDPDGRANAYGITVTYSSDFERAESPTRKDVRALNAAQRSVDLTINAVELGTDIVTKADAKAWVVTVSPDRKIGTHGVADTIAYRASDGDSKEINTEFGSKIVDMTDTSKTNIFSDGLSAQGGDPSLLVVGAHELSHGAEGNIDLEEGPISENDVRPRIQAIVKTSPDVKRSDIKRTFVNGSRLRK